jgi:hypothetical protein
MSELHGSYIILIYVHYVGARPTWFIFFRTPMEHHAPPRVLSPHLDTTGVMSNDCALLCKDNSEQCTGEVHHKERLLQGGLNLNSVNQLIFVMVRCGVLFEVRTGFLNNI